MVGTYFGINGKRMTIPITLVVNLGYMTFSIIIDNLEGNTPPLENMFGKNPQKNKG